jgi:hypothetical protein
MLAHQLQVVSEGESSLKTILDLLRRSSKYESTRLLDSIREAQSIDHFVKIFNDANLLLPHIQQRPSELSINIAYVST